MTPAALQFVRFCLVGGIGFAVDAGLLWLLLLAGLGPYGGRVVSFLLAATVTWRLNRGFTFGAAPARRQWTRYVVLTGVGAAINYGVYAACLLLWPLFRLHPPLAVAVGSVAALAYNFLAAKYLVFRPA